MNPWSLAVQPSTPCLARPLAGFALAVVAAIFAGGGAGCGRLQSDYSRVTLVEGGGRVTLDARPLAGVTVVFRDPEGSFAWGVTDGEGRYRLRFDSVKFGVTPGLKTVLITSQPLSEEGFEPAGDDAAAAGPLAERPDPDSAGERVPAKYNRRSTLSVEVTPATRDYDFALTSD